MTSSLIGSTTAFEPLFECRAGGTCGGFRRRSANPTRSPLDELFAGCRRSADGGYMLQATSSVWMPVGVSTCTFIVIGCIRTYLETATFVG
jgi:hypothetical protein